MGTKVKGGPRFQRQTACAASTSDRSSGNQHTLIYILVETEDPGTTALQWKAALGAGCPRSSAGEPWQGCGIVNVRKSDSSLPMVSNMALWRIQQGGN